jgi:hypothetical protein
MNLSGVADTLIVLTALYTSLAVACSYINESIASLLQLRGATLYKGIFNLLAASPQLVESFYASPFVATASTGTGSASRPSYLDARTFSTAFWETVRRATSDSAGAHALAAVTAPVDELADLRARVAAIDAAGTTPLASMKGPLTSLLTTAGTDYQALLTATDAWFNRQMDRVSGWYRRQTQWMLLALAVLIAFGFGVDTVQIVTRLYGDAKVRTIVSQQIASTYAEEQRSSPGTFAHDLDASLSASSIPIDAFVDTDLRHFFWFRFTSFERFLGALVTAFAITLGAPFWFDVLGNVVNVRLAGAKPSTGTPTVPAPAPAAAPLVVPAVLS